MCRADSRLLTFARLLDRAGGLLCRRSGTCNICVGIEIRDMYARLAARYPTSDQSEVQNYAHDANARGHPCRLMKLSWYRKDPDD